MVGSGLRERVLFAIANVVFPFDVHSGCFGEIKGFSFAYDFVDLVFWLSGQGLDYTRKTRLEEQIRR